MSLSPGRVLPRDMDERQYSAWAGAQKAVPHQDVRTFTPSWNGWSTDPTGDISYVDLGAYVLMFVPDALLGTSDSAEFTISGVPDGLVPASARYVFCPALNNGSNVMAVALVETDGTIVFGIARIFFGGPVSWDFSTWDNAGSKGLEFGWQLLYAK